MIYWLMLKLHAGSPIRRLLGHRSENENLIKRSNANKEKEIE